MNWKRLSAQKNKIWQWRAVDHFRKGILGWVIGDRRHETFWALLNRSMIFEFESFAALTLALSQRRGKKTLSSLLPSKKGWG